MTGENTESIPRTITLIPGDGIGPEVTEAAIRVIEATGVDVTWERCLAGEKIFQSGDPTGVPRETIESIERNGFALKGPLATPVGHGEQSANVTLRMMFELYANIRPARELPGVPTPFGGHRVDLVVVRENVEDLYAGIEYMQTPGVAECLKLMSRKGCEKIVRFAFELARAESRTRIHCATKANIMKLTEGLLKRTFEEIATDYPDIHSEHIIIDNCAHQLVRFPEQFEIIVASNMNGDIISDLTSGLAGGLGFAPSANIGHAVKIFEAVHGSAPTIAGKNIANPTAMILSAVMMLRHLGEFVAATMIEHAILVTLEDGKAVTVDVRADIAATTDQFTDAVINNLGRTSPRWIMHDYKPMQLPDPDDSPVVVFPSQRRDIGVDIFLESTTTPEQLGPELEQLTENTPLLLKMISCRGIQVWPPVMTHIDTVAHWRCRFMIRDEKAEIQDCDIAALVEKLGATHRWMHLEKLAEIENQPAFSRAQGES